mgnify:FL=1
MSPSKEKTKPSSPKKLGAFTLRDDTDSDDAAKSKQGVVFSSRARLQADEPPPTAVAAVRAAAREADTRVPAGRQPVEHVSACGN